MTKALEILKKIRNIETGYDHLVPHKFDEAITELEERINRTCLDCNSNHLKCKLFLTYWKSTEVNSIESARQFSCPNFKRGK